ncbi:Radial spoke head protein 3-like [Hondaea fermentalgiana]|uniref:Radial spoke head protein 3-like n=1 Tax=Hondaea fermentalgiana TaxID=2315210 RepID=A0A2R5GXC9_9STRA|nr:Radial spoke head protein 3-like [Hondaea fermentalgiana]|eukprot:GBG34438.1 Radial spoke head protein 3-like [Hondaea fermentalgiana]
MLQQAGRGHIDISSNLVEQEEPVQTVGMDTQTDTFHEKPESPPYAPRKTGVDVGTQIEDQTELFNFDVEVEPILNIIVTKTLEQSLLEVRQEEEIAQLARAKAHHLAERQRIRAEQEARERLEMQRWTEKEALKRQESGRLARELVLCKKAAANRFFQMNLGAQLEASAIRNLEASGHFRDELRDEVTEVFLPFLEDAVGALVERRENASSLADEILGHALSKRRQRALAYRQAIHDRKAAEALAAAEARTKEKQRRIRIYLRGEDILGTEGMLGPIELHVHESIAAAERAIQEWIDENVLDTTVSAPEGGYLQLALELSEESFDPNDEEHTLEFLTFLDDCVVASSESGETPRSSSLEDQADEDIDANEDDENLAPAPSTTE